METGATQPDNNLPEKHETGRHDPTASRFVYTDDPYTGRPAFFFVNSHSPDIESRAAEVTGSVPALLCTIWLGEDDRPVSVTIQNEDAAGELHALNQYFENLDVRINKRDSVHLELVSSPAVRHTRGAGTLFLDKKGTGCYFRLDLPQHL